MSDTSYAYYHARCPFCEHWEIHHITSVGLRSLQNNPVVWREIFAGRGPAIDFYAQAFLCDSCDNGFPGSGNVYGLHIEGHGTAFPVPPEHGEKGLSPLQAQAVAELRAVRRRP